MPEIDLSLNVAKLVDEMRKAGGFPSDDALKSLAVQIGNAFGARKDEVAILRVAPDGRALRFLYPVKLQKVGEIPLTTAHSLATKTIRDKRGEIVNNFSVFKHPTVFESVDLSAEEKANPIQKIMSVPMVTEGKVAGVIQISRKGHPGDQIGPDFTPKDVTELAAVGSILGKYSTEIPFEPPAAHKHGAGPAKA
jgi:hypothetical protein